MKTDIKILIESLHETIRIKKFSNKEDENCTRLLFSKLCEIEQNESCDAITAEFKKDGNLTVLCR